MKYIYGMRLRGFSPMCQPKGVVERRDDPTGKYYDLIVYNRELTNDELEDYELDYVETEGKKKVYRVCAKSISYVYVDIEAESEEKALEAAEELDGSEFNDDGCGDWEFGDVYEWDTDPDYTYDEIMYPA